MLASVTHRETRKYSRNGFTTVAHKGHAKYKLQYTSYRLHVACACCMLQVTSYKLQVASYKLQVAGYMLQVASCKLQVAGCMLHVESGAKQSFDFGVFQQKSV